MTRMLQNSILRFDALSLRERILVTVALTGLLLFLWDALLLQTLQAERRQQAQNIERLEGDIARLRAAAAELAQQQAADPNAAKRAEIAVLSKEVAAADAELQSLTAGLVAPREMGRVLEEVLGRKSDLRLLSLRSIPAEPLMKDGAAPETTAPRMYKHGIELEFAGDYLTALRFLQALQSLPWRFFWERVDLEVESHPRARVQLTLYTLSFQEGWIGV